VPAATLLDAILDANRRRADGDASACADLAPGAVPFVVSCMDPRLNGRLLPALGLEGVEVPQAKFAGATVRPGDDAAARSVLAAAIFNLATEVIVVGHADCRMGKFSSSSVRDGMARLGVRPEALGGREPAEWLGTFSSGRSSVVASVEALRAHPAVPAGVPVHGLLFRLEDGRAEVVVRGYGAPVPAASAAAPSPGAYASAGPVFRPGPVTLDSIPTPTFGGPGPAGPFLAPGSVDLGASAPPPPLLGPAPSGFGPTPHPVADRPPAYAAPPPPLPTPPSAPSRKPAKGETPFDRAHRTLDRLRRDKGP